MNVWKETKVEKKSSVPILDRRETGFRIAQLREQKGFSVVELQKIFGFKTPQMIYNWQNGTNVPNAQQLLILTYLFGVSIEDIIRTK